MDEDAIEASRQRSLQHVRSAIDKVTHVIEMNRELARDPNHRESAERRIREGEGELVTLREEQRMLLEEPYPPPA